MALKVENSNVTTGLYTNGYGVKENTVRSHVGMETETYKQGAVSEKVNSSEKADSTNTDEAAVFEKSETNTKSVGYAKPSVVEQLKAAAEARQKQLIEIVEKSLSKQAGLYSQANGDDIWKILASGNVKVDTATSLQAQKDISEDGYWGVKQTSQRLFDFASALAGDDVDKMKEMQKAMEKGFRLATGAWGRKLPSICSETMDAANKLFEDYYASKSSEKDQ